MPISAGTKLGHYEILAPLGHGGMGEVYRGRDSRLGREVAVKVLPESLTGNADRLRRFEQEARAASALNHPNIVTIHDLGQEGSINFIVMELIEGVTLRTLIKSGSVPIRKITTLGSQIADGLAKAHESGIVHRDLKPENVMVTPDGLVKILDFGLAKLAGVKVAPFTQDGETSADTNPGVLLGTAGYMSPEQASGGAVEFQSDQFSFGLVLYELLTGKRPFLRANEQRTMLALLRDDPEPVGTLNPEAPAPLCWLIERCLAKEPADRFASTRDLARDLASIRDRVVEQSRRPAEVRPSNLPAQRTGFIGRESEVASVRELLLRDQVRLVTITGTGGIGKTRLALRVAESLNANFSGGIYFIALSSIREADMVPLAVMQTMGIRATPGQSPAETLREHLRNSPQGPLLLIFDNFEHLMPAASLLADMLSVGAELRILVTSRAPLRIYGEHEFHVSLLAVPESRLTQPPNILKNYPAVALFLERAAAIKPGFELTEENSSAVVEICSRLDGLPLAIELAAARVKFLSPAAIRSHLASRLQLLTGGARDLPERQQTLRKAFDWSYDLLSPEEQKLFRRLSVFANGCTLEGVEAVCNTKQDLELDLLDGVAAVVDKSLLQQVDQSSGDARFVMLETVREYGKEKLAQSGEEALTRKSHAAYFLVIAEEWASSERPGTWLAGFDAEHSNFRAALDWLIENTETEWALRMGAALFHFWEMKEYLTEGRHYLGKILSLEGGTPAHRSRALFAAGVLAGEQGDYSASRPLVQESLQLAASTGDKRGQAVSLNALAVHSRDCGDLAAADRMFSEALALWKELGDPMAVARSLSNVAKIAAMMKDFARATALSEEAEAIFREQGDRTGVAWSLNNRGDVAREQGDPEAARVFYEKSLGAFREIGERWGVACALADLGNLARDQGALPAAHAHYQESLQTFERLNHKRGIARLLDCFACSAAVQSNAIRALRLAGAAAALRKTMGAPLTAQEQANLDKRLEAARRQLDTTAGSAAWLEGWDLPLESAIEEALHPQK